MHMAPLPHGGAIAYPHSALGYHRAYPPGHLAAHAPPRPGLPLPRPEVPQVAEPAPAPVKRGRARLAPVKTEGDKPAAQEDDSRWHFSAPAAATAAPPRTAPAVTISPASAVGPMTHQMVAGAPGYLAPATAPPSAARPHAAPPPVAASSTVFEFQAAAAAPAPAPQVATQRLSAPPRPRNFVPQKWRVISAELPVGSTEHLDSSQVRILREGEIVESVGPPFTLQMARFDWRS